MKDDKRLKRKVRNSYIVSTVSIMLVLFLLGSVGYLMVAAMKVAQTLQESIAVTVELQNGISDQQRETINKRLTAEELVATVAYVTKEEKADDAEFRKMFKSEFEEILDENPLLDSFELTLTAESADKELLDGFIASVSGIAGVERVSYPALMAERLHATVGKIRLVLLLFGGALLIISLILLSNTIRLAIFSKRYLINTMKLVGATKWFIMKPFLGSSITQGILAGLGASLLFGLSVFGLNEAVPELTTIAESGKIAVILGAMIAGGVVISGLFTVAALNKSVNMKSNKIYLYEMKKANKNTPAEQENPKMPLTRRNYVLLAIGFAVILLGFVLMAGGGSDSPDQFNYAMFSWRRITLAPILVIGGFVIEIYAILKRYK